MALGFAMSYCLFPDGNPWGQKELDAELQAEAIRLILDTGVKYVCRASTEWHYSDATEAGHADLAKWLEIPNYDKVKLPDDAVHTFESSSPKAPSYYVSTFQQAQYTY